MSEKKKDPALIGADVLISEDARRVIGEALDEARAADVNRTPGIILCLPELGAPTATEIPITTAVHVCATDALLVEMLVSLFTTLLKRGKFYVIAAEVQARMDALRQAREKPH